MLRLGILQAGEINPKMKAGLPGYQDMYSALFSSANDQIAITYIQVRDNEFPASVDDYDAYLVTGSPAGVYDDEIWMNPLKDFIRLAYAQGKRLIGVCFGHQVIAEVLGGSAEKSDKGWGVGVRTVEIKAHQGIIPDDVQAVDLLYMHQDQVTKAPPQAEVLAGDAFCPIAAYTIDDQVLSLQGHPEFTPEVIAGILDFRKDTIGEERVSQGHESLATPHQGAFVGQWMIDFLTKPSPDQKTS